MRLLIASSIHPPKVEVLKKEHDVVCAFNAKEDVLKEVIKDREVLIFRSGVQITAEVMACAPDLKLLIRAGSGFDNVDLNYVKEKGLAFIRIPEPGAKAVSEMAFGLMLALSRNIVHGDKLWRAGRWAKKELTGYLLTKKTLGIVGCGNIGTRTAKLGDAWGMRAIGCVENPSRPREKELMEKNHVELMDFDQVVSQSDYLCIHVPKNANTLNLINKSVFEKMKKGSYLINLARGGVVNETDLREALLSGHLAGAGMDVHENEGEGNISPLADLDNVVLTPHIGAQAYDSQEEIGDRIHEILNDFMAKASEEATKEASVAGV